MVQSAGDNTRKSSEDKSNVDISQMIEETVTSEAETGQGGRRSSGHSEEDDRFKSVDSQSATEVGQDQKDGGDDLTSYDDVTSHDDGNSTSLAPDIVTTSAHDEVVSKASTPKTHVSIPTQRTGSVDEAVLSEHVTQRVSPMSHYICRLVGHRRLPGGNWVDTDKTLPGPNLNLLFHRPNARQTASVKEYMFSKDIQPLFQASILSY